MRKTIDRNAIIESANKALTVDETLYPRNNKDMRQGIINVIGSILHASNSYKGFHYLHTMDLDNSNNVPGINGDIVAGNMTYDERFDNTDSTRICFIS